MRQTIHGRARTTQVVRKEIQESPLSLNKLAQKYGGNPKTFAEWKKEMGWMICL